MAKDFAGCGLDRTGLIYCGDRLRDMMEVESPGDSWN